MRAIKVAFVVQGEGRGHMTQALALSAFLRDAGHEVTEVLIGRSPHRSLPRYFVDGIGAPVREFHAPVQVPRADGRGLSIGRTVVDVLKRSPEFIRSVVAIAERTAEVDLVINLLDFLGGVSRRLFPSDVPALAIAHNYIFLHPALRDAPGPDNTRRLVMAYTRATAAGASRKLALSFSTLPPRPELGIEVTPPLLRPGLDELEARDGNYLLAYALNPGYVGELLEWHRRTTPCEAHCYVEGGAETLTSSPHEGFHVHDLAEEPFLDHLAGCRAYVGSAGFEAICEAHYLGKPVLAVPTGGQFEQTLNAWDAQRCGVARAGTYADLEEFWRTATAPEPDRVSTFRDWVERAPQIFVDAVERASHTR